MNEKPQQRSDSHKVSLSGGALNADVPVPAHIGEPFHLTQGTQIRQADVDGCETVLRGQRWLQEFAAGRGCLVGVVG